MAGCSVFIEREDNIFESGEYGGDPVPGSESLYNIRLSPDGARVALIREFTPGEATDPHRQLWVMERDGSDPRLIGVGVGPIDWSPNGSSLAVSVATGIERYIYTIDLTSGKVRQWSGSERHVLSKPTANLPIWFQDGRRLLISVDAKAYMQEAERGIYVLDTGTGEVKGPLVEFMDGARLGNRDQYVIGTKYTAENNRFDGNAAVYNIKSDEWHWWTKMEAEELRFVDVPIPNPTGREVVQSRFVNNAWQLFLLKENVDVMQQISRLGGDNPHWSYDGKQIIFRRDVHNGEGAKYVPFVYDLDSKTEEPLWPSLPDSLPLFPPISNFINSSAAIFGR